MMKKFTLLLVLFFGLVASSNAQFLENFDADTNIPAGWTVINQGGLNTWNIGAPNGFPGPPAHSGTNVARISYNSTAHDDYLITPEITPVSGVNDRITFWVRNGDTTFYNDHYEVRLSTTDASSSSNFSVILVPDTPSPADWSKVIVDLTPYVGQPIYIAFRALSTDELYLFIDDVENDTAPAGPPNCDAVLTTPTDGATDANIFGNITWSAATGDPTGYNLTVGTTPGGNDVLATTDVANVTTYNVGSLQFETMYYVSIVPYSSNGNATGCTEYSFTTIPAPAPGNLCENPIVVTLPYETTDDTANYSDIYYEGAPGSSCGSTSGYLNGNDVVYAYTATVDGSINVNLTNVGTYTGLFAYASCSSIGSSCIGGAVNGFAGGPLSLMEFPVVTGETYYFLISTWASPQTTAYTLSIVENTCTNATATYTVVSDCANGEQFLVDVDVTSLGTATSLTVTDDQGSAPQTVSATGVVQFGPYQNATPVVFTVSNDQDSNCVITSPTKTQAVCPPANDLCSGAIDLGLETSPLDGTTVGANNNNTPTCGGTSASPDVYYSISVPSGSTLTISQTANSYDSVVSMFYGNCTNPTAITCYDEPDNQVNTWANTTGSDQTVYFVVDGYGFTGSSGTFTLAWSVLACSNATATYTVVSDCANGEQFLVDVNVTSLGTATSLTVSDDQGSAPQSVSATGVVQFGPYPNATPVVFTVTNDQDSNCVITSPTKTQSTCPPSCATMTSPANLATDVALVGPGTVALAWEAPTSGNVPTAYTIMWGTSEASLASLGTNTGLTTNIINVLENTTYYWSIVPLNAGGSATGCDVFSFTTGTWVSPGYCLNSQYGLYPAATYTPTCDGPGGNITTFGYASEYSNVNVVSGTEYVFTSSTATDFITIGNADGTVALTYGATPVTWTSDVDGVIRFYTHTSDQCGGSNTSRTRAVSCTTLATDTFDNANFTYKPNPVVDVLNLEYNKTITSVAVYNLVGQQVIAKTVNANMSQVDMSALPTGTYMVKVTSNNEVKTIKVVKQ